MYYTLVLSEYRFLNIPAVKMASQQQSDTNGLNNVLTRRQPPRADSGGRGRLWNIAKKLLPRRRLPSTRKSMRPTRGQSNGEQPQSLIKTWTEAGDPMSYELNAGGKQLAEVIEKGHLERRRQQAGKARCWYSRYNKDSDRPESEHQRGRPGTPGGRVALQRARSLILRSPAAGMW